jgi:hypothetical protein
MIDTIPNLNRNDATFRTDVNNFFGGGLQQMITQINETNASINTSIGFALTSAIGTSATSLTVGTGSKSLTIETGKSFAVGMDVKIANTANPANYMTGVVSSYTSSSGALVVSVSTTGGSGTLAAWTITMIAATAAAKTLPISTRTSNTILDSADAGKLIDITTGGFTQTLTAVATLGAGWYVYIRNASSSSVTIDPNGTETIDGATTGTLASGMQGIIVCTGTGFIFYRDQSVYTQEILTSGTSWTCPVGVRRVKVRAVGGGGGGGRTSGGTYWSSGGGGGGYCEVIYTVVPGTSYAYAIGAAGAEAGATTTPGSAGGNTTGFGLTANGGAGGLSTGGSAAGGSASGGTVNIAGGASMGFAATLALSQGGNSQLGMGGVKSVSVAVSQTGYGSGGYGGSSTTAGTAGNQGCIILEY